jgi:hypothetical protein
MPTHWRLCGYYTAEPDASLEETAAEGILGTDTRGEDRQKIRIEQHTFMGTVWLAGWLFTIGFLHLAFWQGVLAIVLWPYYLGAHFSSMAH